MFFLRLPVFCLTGKKRNFFRRFSGFLRRYLRLVLHEQVSFVGVIFFIKTNRFSADWRICGSLLPVLPDFDVKKYPFSTILFTTLLSHASCPIFIGPSMKPLSTSFQRFSPVIVAFFWTALSFVDVNFSSRVYRLPPNGWRRGCFSSGFFRRWSPNVNLDKLTTCFTTCCLAPRSCFSDIFAVIFFFHDAPLIVALCLVLMHSLHLRRVYFGHSPA